ncbi:MAG: LptE family protein [Desulfovibrionaceae bacterium]|nr:LptE family protein [Desulfovibrionaceae bacterium]
MLPERFKTLAIKRVDNPTMETWIEDELRAAVRDEITRRRFASWAHAEDADALLFLEIESYTVPGTVRNYLDTSLKYAIEMVFRARVDARETHEHVWDSGTITVYETFHPGEESAARLRVMERAARVLADAMGQAY